MIHGGYNVILKSNIWGKKIIGSYATKEEAQLKMKFENVFLPEYKERLGGKVSLALRKAA